MANIYTSLLNTAGLSPDQYGLDVLLDLPNRSVFMGQGGPMLIKSYAIEKGNTLYAPTLGARSATAVTRGASETTAMTFTAISDSAVSFTKRFAYDAWEIGYPTLNDMPPAHLRATLLGLREQATMALKNDFDSQMLSLYSSAANTVGSSGVDFSVANLAEAIKLLEVANAPRPYAAVLPSTQWDHLAASDELIRFDIRGETSPIVTGTGFRYFDVNIYTTGNVPTAAGAAHGLVFSRDGIIAAIRDFPVVKEWDEPEDFAMRMAIYVDFAYANSFSDWIVDFATSDA